MITYNPKLQFQANTERREAWRQMAGSPILQSALTHAQAHMAQAGFGPDEMRGVNAFIVGLLNLSEDAPQPKALPARQLSSYDQPAKPADKTEPKK